MSASIPVPEEVAAMLAELAEHKGTSEEQIVERAIRDYAAREAQVRATVERALGRLSTASELRNEPVVIDTWVEPTVEVPADPPERSEAEPEERERRQQSIFRKAAEAFKSD